MDKLKPQQVRSWVERHFPDFKERKDGAELIINNPFDGDTGHNFNISLTHFGCHDWRGDHWQGLNQKTRKTYKRTFLHFVRVYLGCTWSEAVRSVTGQAGRFLLPARQERSEPDPQRTDIALPAGSVPLLESPQPKLSTILLNWLGSRGVDRTDVGRYRIHHTGSDVVWPYYEFEELVYWQSRSLLNKRFCFPPREVGVTKGQFLYGFDDIEPASHLVITEAIFDKHALRDQTVATGGAVLTKKQLLKIRLLGPRDGVILAPDNDEAGLASIVSNGRLLLDRGHRVYYSVPPKMTYRRDGQEQVTKDWNELGQFVVGWEEVPALMERGIEKFTKASEIAFQLNR